MIKRLVIVLLALGLLLGGLFGWKYRMDQQRMAEQSAPQPPAVVSAVEVTRKTWQPELFAVGSLVGVQSIYVTNEVAGQVSAIAFESGQAVEAGALLLQIDDSVDRAELEGLIAARRLAEVQFQRAARLVQERSLSRSEYDVAKATLESAEASVQSKRAAIAKKRIRAPFSGLLGIRQIDLGEYLAPGAQIVPLQALNPIYADYALPEQHIAEIGVGQEVRIRVPAYKGEVFAGRVSAVNPGIDTGTRNIRVRATLENADHRLRPGMFAEVRTLLPNRRDVLTLPRTAIVYNPYGDSVFAIHDDNGQLTVQRRQVETGAVQAGHVEIVEGLALGDRVVNAGQVKLRNGQPIEVDDSAAPAGQGSGS